MYPTNKTNKISGKNGTNSNNKAIIIAAIGLPFLLLYILSDGFKNLLSSSCFVGFIGMITSASGIELLYKSGSTSEVKLSAPLKSFDTLI